MEQLRELDESQLTPQEQIVGKAAAGETYFNVALALVEADSKGGIRNWIVPDGIVHMALHRVEPTAELLKLAKELGVDPKRVPVLGKVEVLNNGLFSQAKKISFISQNEMKMIQGENSQ